MTIKFKPANGFTEEQVILPKRQTLGSNGYDFYATKDVTLKREKEGQKTLYMVSTGVTADFPSNVVLLLFNRSSNPGRGLIMPNGVGVVDSDYSQGTNNEIKGLFYNASFEDVHIKKGDRIFQGVFVPSLLTDDDNPEPNRRESGFGSTGNDVEDKGTSGGCNEDTLTYNVKVLLENYHKGQATADYEFSKTRFWGKLPRKDERTLADLGYKVSYHSDMAVNYAQVRKVR